MRKISSIEQFIHCLKIGAVGINGFTPKFRSLVECFSFYESRIGNDKAWLEFYGELAEIIEAELDLDIEGTGSINLLHLPKNAPMIIKGKMNDDGTYNPPYRLKKGSK